MTQHTVIAALPAMVLALSGLALAADNDAINLLKTTGALDRLEGFASFHGADFYGLPRATERVTLRREPWTLPAEFMAGGDEIVPLGGGESIGWRME